MIEKQNVVLDDVEIEFIAEAYLRLQQNKTYLNLSKTFLDFINEYLSDALVHYNYLKNGGGKRNGKKLHR